MERTATVFLFQRDRGVMTTRIPIYSCLAFVAGMMLSTVASGQYQRPASRRVPAFLLTSVLAGDFTLGDRIVELTRALFAHEIPDTTLHTIRKVDIDKMNEAGVEVKLPWSGVDLREVGNQLNAVFTIDIVADSSDAGIQVVASRLFPPDTLRKCVVISAHDRDDAARALAGRILADVRSSRNAGTFACGNPTLLRPDRMNRPKH